MISSGDPTYCAKFNTPAIIVSPKGDTAGTVAPAMYYLFITKNNKWLDLYCVSEPRVPEVNGPFAFIVQTITVAA